jgi:hypothetical protein
VRILRMAIAHHLNPRVKEFDSDLRREKQVRVDAKSEGFARRNGPITGKFPETWPRNIDEDRDRT